MEDTNIYELVHMQDQTKFKVNWSDPCHRACRKVGFLPVLVYPVSDSSCKIHVRYLSGDCRFTREIHHSIFSFLEQQVCLLLGGV
jgi:hypothetical protein